MYASGIENIFTGFIASFIIAIVCIIGIMSYGAYKYFSAEIIETKVKINPELRIETNGKQSDTTYIYRFDN